MEERPGGTAGMRSPDLVVGSGTGQATGGVPSNRLRQKERKNAQVWGSSSPGLRSNLRSSLGGSGSLGGVGSGDLSVNSWRHSLGDSMLSPPSRSIPIQDLTQGAAKVAAAQMAKEVASRMGTSAARWEVIEEAMNGLPGVTVSNPWGNDSPLGGLAADSAGGQDDAERPAPLSAQSAMKRRSSLPFGEAAGTLPPKKLASCDKCGGMTPWRLTMPCGRKVCLCPFCTSSFLQMCDRRARQNGSTEHVCNVQEVQRVAQTSSDLAAGPSRSPQRQPLIKERANKGYVSSPSSKQIPLVHLLGAREGRNVLDRTGSPCRSPMGACSPTFRCVDNFITDDLRRPMAGVSKLMMPAIVRSSGSGESLRKGWA